MELSKVIVTVYIWSLIRSPVELDGRRLDLTNVIPTVNNRNTKRYIVKDAPALCPSNIALISV